MSHPRERTPDDDTFAPLDRWLEQAENAPIPRSARSYAPDLHAELVAAVEQGASLSTVAEGLKSARGTDRRSRALRILDRVGLIERALRSYEESRRRAADSDRTDHSP